MGTLPVIALITITVVLMLIVLSRRKKESSIDWIIARDDEFYKPDNNAIYNDNSFVNRVVARVEQKPEFHAVPDGNWIRVYRGNRRASIIWCCEIGRNVTPAMIRQLVEVANHSRVKTMYLATVGPMPKDTERFARVQKVRIISL